MSSWSDDGVVVKDEDGEIVVIGNAINPQQMLSLAYKLSLLQGFPIGGKPPVTMQQNDDSFLTLNKRNPRWNICFIELVTSSSLIWDWSWYGSVQPFSHRTRLKGGGVL